MIKLIPWRRRSKNLSAADAEFMNDVQASLLSQTTPGSKLVMWIIIAVIGIGLTWANYVWVEEITKGDGKVISRSREQVIQSLEGGILAEMNVREGTVFNRGNVLLKIDPTRSQSSYREALSKVIGLKGSIARLRAEAYAQPLAFDD